jgi:hypothetical protein
MSSDDRQQVLVVIVSALSSTYALVSHYSWIAGHRIEPSAKEKQAICDSSDSSLTNSLRRDLAKRVFGEDIANLPVD